MSDPNPPMAQYAQPLNYVAPPRVLRSGLVTAIGVMSVVLGALSILVGLLFGVQSVAMMAFTSSATVTARGTLVSSGAGTQGTAASQYQSPRGWDPAAARVAVAALSEVQALTVEQQQQLESLLLEFGQDVFPFDADQATSARVKSSVSDSGALRSQSGLGAVYFVVGNGRIELSDRDATFLPSGRSNPIHMTTVSAGVVPSGGGATAAATLPVTTNPFAAVSVLAPLAMLLAVLGNLALAIYLLVIGIMVLRHSSSGARLHWIYVILKIPLSILAALAFAWMMSSLFGFARAGLGVSSSRFWTLILVYAGAIAVFGCAYPFGLIFALRSRRVREYYQFVWSES